MKKFLLFLFCLVSPLMASAESGTCGDNLTWELSNGVLTISGAGAMTNYSSSYLSRAPWYSYRSTISRAIISDGVTNIGAYAFYECSNLTSITIPSSVTSIGYEAFSNCSGLTSVNISDLTSWCNIDFDYYSSNPTEYAHKLVLNGTEIKDLVIPEEVTTIKALTFYGCSGLTSVTIPNSVTSIGYDAFRECSGLTAVTIGNSVTSIGYEAFSNCSGLTSITIPSSVTSIEDKAFYGCSGLTSVTIPNSVTSIGNSAFDGCYIQKDKFINNSSCNSTSNWGARLFDEETADGLIIKDNVAIKCRPWATSITIPNSVTSIAISAFYGCSGLSSITIPNSVTSIGWGAFEYCSGLTSITIPNSVKSIDPSVFSGCRGLTSVTIPNSVTSIGSYAFSGCSGLTSVTIPNSVTSIGNSAFYGCSGLTSITIPNSVTSIGDHAFYECKLMSIRFLSEEAPETGSDVFSNPTYYHATAYVPMGSWINYAYHNELYKFINIREEATNTSQVETQNTYFIMDYANMSCLKYDKVNDRLVNVASSSPFDESDLDASWTLVKVNGTYYVYNMGAEKFLGLTPTGYVLQTTPTALTISNAENALRLGNNNTEWSLVRNTQLMPKDITGIGTVLMDVESKSIECNYYNLQGQRKVNTSRGLNIVDGKKMLVH